MSLSFTKAKFCPPGERLNHIVPPPVSTTAVLPEIGVGVKSGVGVLVGVDVAVGVDVFVGGGDARASSVAEDVSGGEVEVETVEVTASETSAVTSGRLSIIVGGPAKAPVSGVAGVDATVGDNRSVEETTTSSKLVPDSSENVGSASPGWSDAELVSSWGPSGTPAKKKPIARISKAIA